MATARLIVTTQCRENYGWADWDGKGECPQDWKCKFGSEYQISAISVDEALKGEKYLLGLVNASNLEYRNNAFEVYIIDWGLYWDGEQTPMEKLGLQVKIKEVS